MYNLEKPDPRSAESTARRCFPAKTVLTGTGGSIDDHIFHGKDNSADKPVSLNSKDIKEEESQKNHIESFCIFFCCFCCC